MAVYSPLASSGSVICTFMWIIQLGFWYTPVMHISFVSLLKIASSLLSRYMPYPASANFLRESKFTDKLWAVITLDSVMILFYGFFKYKLPFSSILIFAFLLLLAVLISPTVLLTKSFSKNPLFVKGMPYTGNVFCCIGHNVFN